MFISSITTRPFGVDLVGPEGRTLEHLGEQLETGAELAVEHPRPETRVLLGRERVALRSDGVERLGRCHGPTASPNP